MADVKKAVRVFLALRDRIDALKKAHKEEVKELKAKQEQLGKYLQTAMDELGVDSMKTEGGTAYKTKKDSVTVQTKAEFLCFILERIEEEGVDGLYYLTGAASKNAIKEWMDEHDGGLPPGIKYDQFYEVQVRRESK